MATDSGVGWPTSNCSGRPSGRLICDARTAGVFARYSNAGRISWVFGMIWSAGRMKPYVPVSRSSNENEKMPRMPYVQSPESPLTA